MLPVFHADNIERMTSIKFLVVSILYKLTVFFLPSLALGTLYIRRRNQLLRENAKKGVS